MNTEYTEIEQKKEYYWQAVAISVANKNLDNLRKAFFALRALEAKSTIKA